MKHNVRITIILIALFVITQFIGLFVVSTYMRGLHLPYGMEPPPEIKESPQGLQIIIAFALAVTLFFVLIKMNAETFIRIWFFIVTTIALGLTINALLYSVNVTYYASFIALLIALPLTYLKIFKREVFTHNLTELLIYPGIAAVFIPLLNVLWIIILLIIISLYDIWAVWHSEFMQKMAKYQINNLKFFTGFFIPYTSKKERKKIELIKDKYHSAKEREHQFKKAKIKMSLAILGGGDIIFPIITAGIFYKTYGSIYPAIIIITGATCALIGLFITAQKGKFYPAMPFITIGIYLSMIVSWLIF